MAVLFWSPQAADSCALGDGHSSVAVDLVFRGGGGYVRAFGRAAGLLLLRLLCRPGRRAAFRDRGGLAVGLTRGQALVSTLIGLCGLAVVVWARLALLSHLAGNCALGALGIGVVHFNALTVDPGDPVRVYLQYGGPRCAAAA